MRTTGARPGRARSAAVALGLLLTAACTGGGSGGVAIGPDTGEGEEAVLPEETTTTAPPPCREDLLAAAGIVPVTDPAPAASAAEVAAGTHRCADVVVLAPAADPWAATLAVPVAVAADAPLLLVDGSDGAAARAELDRLEAGAVVAVGTDAGAALAAGDPPAGVAFDGEVTVLLAPDAAPAPAPAAPPDTTPPAAPGDPAAGGPAAPSPTTGATTPTTAPGDTATTAAPGGTATTAAPSDTAAAPTDTTVAPAAPPALPAESRLALQVIDHLAATSLLAVPLDDLEARAAVAGHLTEGAAVLPVPEPAALAPLAAELPAGLPVTVLATDPARAEATAAALTAAGVAATAATAPLWSEAAAHTAWVVDPAQGAAAAVAGAAAAGRGEVVRPVDAADLRRVTPWTMGLRAVDPERVVLVGDIGDHAAWQLPVVLDGPPLPGGGFALFDDERIVALYGHPVSSALGALGEQDLDATIVRAREVAAPYGADGLRPLPAFELIATVASAESGDLGDYSRRTSIDVLRPYVERAAAEGFYVVLDLQPGRTDFLTQAKEYEELLRLPHVGLALDPEWRLEPDEVHLRQIGSVAAPEVQQVADWLAQLTRDNGLPEKLLVLHQFRLDMLPDRDTVVPPPELAVVVHMDGQGPIGSKDGTYRAITQGAEDRWHWGWKNFYDEDDPTPTPDHVLAQDPLPVMVTYQ